MAVEYKLNQIRRYNGQVYKCIQAHTVHPGQETTHNPEAFRAGWGIYHGTTYDTAKPYVAPLGTSGIYMKGDCCIWTDGNVYQSIIDNNSHTPKDYPAGWKIVPKDVAIPSEDPVVNEPEDPVVNEPEEPVVETIPTWASLPANHAFAIGDKFKDYTKTYEVLREFTKQENWRPPALIDNFYKVI